MATLADLLRAGYVPPTESALADPIKEHFRTLPQQLATNQAALDKAMSGWNKTDFATGQANPNYYPEAIQELTQLMPNVMGATAWHGTPHKIQGNFDINKVGTGEGAQAYGHGMYFAESPDVAKTYVTATNPSARSAYMHLQANNGNIAETIKEAAKDVKRMEENQQFLVKGALEQAKEKLNFLQAQKAGKTIETGNLYKVDIPDEHIPNMLNWDEKVPEDLRKRISAATMEKFGNGATGTSGEHLYKEIVFEMRRNGSKTPEADASKWLLNQGVTGIKYQDEGSRNWRMLTPEESTSGKYVVGKWPGGGKESKQFDNLEDAQKYFNKNQTKNFVVFDPSTVKILEENAKPVSRKEIIEKQIKSLKE